jgi:aspartyl/asparaginyl beta-hydroxylase (cupin superfamily)
VKNFYKVERDMNEDDKWKAEPIMLFSYLFKENAERCADTFDVISKIPGCCAAMFSVLEPGKYIPPHKGIYKGIYRCLFVLQLDKDADCWIRVNDSKIFFKEGELVMFDETAEHEVMNASNSSRVALYLDVYRKLPFPLNIFNKMLFFIIRKSPFVQNILKEYMQLDNVNIETFVPAKPVLQ